MLAIVEEISQKLPKKALKLTDVLEVLTASVIGVP
jgi:hypothetical protein